MKLLGSEWIGIREIFIGFALVWLLMFILLDIRDILKEINRFNEAFPLKNLFVIFVIGYVMF